MKDEISKIVDKICFDPEVGKTAKMALELVVQQAEIKERVRVVQIASSLAGIGSLDGESYKDAVLVPLTKLLEALPVH